MGSYINWECFTDWDRILYSANTVDAILCMDISLEEKKDEAQQAYYDGDIDECSYNILLNRLNQ